MESVQDKVYLSKAGGESHSALDATMPSTIPHSFFLLFFSPTHESRITQ